MDTMDIKEFNKIQGDLHLLCMECGFTFWFEEGERKYYASKGLATPKRCPKCRAFRKASIDKPKQQTS